MKKKAYNLCQYLTAVLVMVNGIFQKSMEWTLVGCTLYIATVIDLKKFSVDTHVKADNVYVVERKDTEDKP